MQNECIKESRVLFRVMFSYFTPLLIVAASLFLVKKTNENIILGEFEIKGIANITELNYVATLYKHRKYKYEFLNINTKEKENHFAIAFKYLPYNHNGIPNILLNIPKFSANPYQNIDYFKDFFQESIQFQFSSFYKSEFEQQLRNVLNNIFEPNITENNFLKSTFYFKPTSNPFGNNLSAAGSAFESSKNQIFDKNYITNQAIFSAIYNESGFPYGIYGNPLSFTNISYNQTISDYFKYFKPQNSLFYHFGDYNEEDILKIIASTVKNNGSKAGFKLNSHLQPLNEPVYKIIHAHNISISDYQKRSTVTWLISDVSNLSELIDVDVLSHLILDNGNNSIQNQLISTAFVKKICESKFYFKTGVPRLTICADGVSLEEVFSNQLQLSLETILKNGFSEEKIQEVLQNYEINLRENSRHLGHDYFSNVVNPWIYGYSPLNYIKMTWEVERIKKLLAVQPKYFELVMRRRLIENKNRIDIDFVNDNNFKFNFNYNLSEIVSEYENTDKSIQNNENEENEKYKFSNFSFSEVIDSIYKSPNKLEKGYVYSYEEPTNDVVYIRIKNSINLDEEVLEDFPIFLDIFGKTGVDGISQEEFNALIEKSTGGISIRYLISAGYDTEDSANLNIIIEGKSLSKNANNLIEYMTSIISKPNLGDYRQMMSILQESYDSYTKNLMLNATNFSRMFSSAALSRAAALQEMLFGITYYKRLGKYLNNDKRENILDLISILYEKKFINGYFTASLHCNCESRQRIEKRLVSLMEKLNSHQPIEKGIDTIRLFISEMSIYQKTAFKSDHSPPSVTFSIPVPPLGNENSAAYYVAAKILCSGYLNEIVDSSYGERLNENTNDPSKSVIYFTIENVKNVTEMIDKMMTKLKNIKENTFTDEDVKKCIYAILKTINAPQAPFDRNVDMFLNDFSAENKISFYRQLFYLTLNDIYKAIKLFTSSKIHISVVANSPSINNIENFNLIQYNSY